MISLTSHFTRYCTQSFSTPHMRIQTFLYYLWLYMCIHIRASLYSAVGLCSFPYTYAELPPSWWRQFRIFFNRVRIYFSNWSKSRFSVAKHVNMQHIIMTMTKSSKLAIFNDDEYKARSVWRNKKLLSGYSVSRDF